jgi:hypothetical protein
MPSGAMSQNHGDSINEDIDLFKSGEVLTATLTEFDISL